VIAVIKIIDAHKRLVRLSNLGENSEVKIFTSSPTYWCKDCDKTTRFRIDSHQPHQPAHIEQEFNQTMGEFNVYEKGFSNFCCRHCGLKVRCTYSINEFAMSSYHYFPLKILIYND